MAGREEVTPEVKAHLLWLKMMTQKRKAGKLGGKAGKGKAKARTSNQARIAANKRWDNYRAEQEKIRAEKQAKQDTINAAKTVLLKMKLHNIGGEILQCLP